MKNTLLFFLFILFGFTANSQMINTTLTFEDIVEPKDSSVVRATKDATTISLDFKIPNSNNLITMLSYYDTAYNYWSGGWAISESQNDSVGTYLNLYGCISGEGANNSKAYAVGQNGSSIKLPENTTLTSIAYNNLTFTYEVLKNGNSFARAFGVDTVNNTNDVKDSLILRIISTDSLKLPLDSISVALADYRFDDSADDYIVKEWRTKNAAITGTHLIFKMESSVRNQYGNTTPNFFVIDNIGLQLNLVSVFENPSLKPLHIYPNPVVNQTTFGDGYAFGELLIADQTGRVVFVNSAYQAGTKIDLSLLPKGMYVARFISEGNTFASKMIKQ